MQTTAHSQTHPNTLIKNFFIVGVKQPELMDKIIKWNQKTESKKFEACTPEVLFSLYSAPEEASTRLGPIFPNKVQVNFDRAFCKPKFFTFSAKENDINQMYFHTLIYYEQVSTQQILFDFDANKERAKLELYKKLQDVNIRKHLKRFNGSVQERSSGGTETSASSTDETLEDQEMIFDNKEGVLAQIAKNKIIEAAKQKAQKEQTISNESCLLRISNYHKLRGVNQPQKQRDKATNELESISESDEVRNSVQSSSDQQSSGQLENHERAGHEVPIVEEFEQEENAEDDVTMFVPVALVIATEVEYHDIFRELMLDLFENIRNPLSKQLNKKLDTNQDALKMTQYDRRLLSFSEFIAKIAFLKTIPCPTFNMRYNIQFHDKTLIIQEGPFNQLPDNNQIAIKLLLQMLDVKQIFFCWKALIFDKSLVLISQQYSLQFYIAEALKQLMFPLTWQNAYIQPADSTTIELIESPMPILICCSDADFQSLGVSAFEYCEELRKSVCPNLCILDIDGGITNEAEIAKDDEKNKQNMKLPPCHLEELMLKTLNQLKQKQMQSFDNAFHDRQAAEFNNQTLVMDVRNLFFNILKVFLAPILREGRNGKPLYFKNFEKTDVSAVFKNYFKVEDYLELFAGEGGYNDDGTPKKIPAVEQFSKLLVEGGAFQHFCDDYFATETTNFHMFKAILMRVDEDSSQKDDGQNFDISPVEKRTVAMTKGKSNLRHEQIVDVENKELRKLAQDFALNEFPSNKELVVDWRMPQDCKRVMVFEKLYYYLKSVERNKNMDKKFMQDSKILTKKIKELYKNFLPEYKDQFQKYLTLFEETKDEHPVISEQGSDYSAEQIKSEHEKQMTSSYHSKKYSSSQNSLNLLVEQQLQEQERLKEIEANKNCSEFRIVNMTYGEKGLIRFLEDLFSLILQDDKTQAFNYYFSLRQIFEKLDNYSDNQQYGIYWTGDKEAYIQKHKVCNTILKEQVYFQIVQSDKIMPGHETSFVQQLISPSIWMMPNDWKEHYGSIRKSPQYIMMQIKSSSKFEDVVEKSEIAFFEMLRWPQHAKDYFPRQRLLHFLNDLPLKQKKSMVEHIKKIPGTEDNLCLEIFEEQIALEEQELLNKDKQKTKKGITIYTLKDQVFGQVNIQAAVEERKRKLEMEFREKQKQEEAARLEQIRQISMNNIQQQSNNIKDKINKDKKDKSERSFFGFFNRSTVSDGKGRKASVINTPQGKNDPRKSIESPGNNRSGGSSGGQRSGGGSSGGNPEEESKGPNFNDQDQEYRINQSIVGSVELSKESVLFQSQAKLQQIVSERQPQDGQLKIKLNGVAKSIELLETMVELFSRRKLELQLDHRPLDPDVLPSVQNELLEIKKRVDKMAYQHFVFECTVKEHEETVKQCFWLNIINFMTLFKLAEIKLTQPRILKEMTKFQMWISFMVHNTIVISGVQLNQFVIWKDVLRHKLSQPSITKINDGINFVQPITDPFITDLFVAKPNKFIAYGMFLPIQKMPELRIYRQQTLDEQLKCQVKIVNSGQLSASPQNFLVSLPKFLKWFAKDFAETGQQNDLQQSNDGLKKATMDDSQSSIEVQSPVVSVRNEKEICDFEENGIIHFLEILSSERLLSSDEKESMILSKMVAQVRAERAQLGQMLHTFEFYPFNWVLSTQFLKDCINEVAKTMKVAGTPK